MTISLQHNEIFKLDSAGKIKNSVTLLLIAYNVIISCIIHVVAQKPTLRLLQVHHHIHSIRC